MRPNGYRSILAVAPAALLVLVGAVLPLVNLFVVSLGHGNGSFPAPSAFAAAVVVQLLLACLIVPLELAVGAALALALPRHGPAFTIILALLLVPPLLPPAVVAVITRMLAAALSGLSPWAVLLLVDLWHWAPLIAAPALVALRSIPLRALTAALFDGLSPWARFRHLVLPRLAPVLWVGAGVRLAGVMGLTAEPMGTVLQGHAPAQAIPGTLLLEAGGATGFTALLTFLLGLLTLLAAGILVARASPIREPGS